MYRVSTPYILMDIIFSLMLVGSSLESKEQGSKNALSIQVRNNILMMGMAYAERVVIYLQFSVHNASAC